MKFVLLDACVILLQFYTRLSQIGITMSHNTIVAMHEACGKYCDASVLKWCSGDESSDNEDSEENMKMISTVKMKVSKKLKTLKMQMMM